MYVRAWKRSRKRLVDGLSVNMLNATESCIRTFTSLIMPYPSHNVLGTCPNASTNASLCLCDRGIAVGSLSRIAGRAVHLKLINAQYILISIRLYLLWTPALYDTSEKSLFRIVSDVRTQSIYDAPKVPITTSRYAWLRHPGLK